MISLRMLRSSLAIATALLGTGCASMSGVQDRYLVCSYDTVWDTAMEVMKDRPIMVQDKAQGVIETGWVEMEAAARPYGVFERDLFDIRERARMTLLVKRVDDVTAISLSENRESWHRRGGVTQQATKWWPIEPSEEAMASVLNRLNAKLKERGCSAA